MAAAGSQHSRHLLQEPDYTPKNNSGKAAALAESAVRTTATLESVHEYIKRAAPINLKDLLTPVGNFTDATVFWDSFTTFSQYVPGAILYTVKSIPDMLDDARTAIQTKWDNDALMAKLVRLTLACPHPAWNWTPLPCIALWRRLHAAPTGMTTQSAAAQDKTFVIIFKALEANINPTVTGLALRLAFHDAATWNPFNPVKGGCVLGLALGWTCSLSCMPS